jgi:hypothetical protein
MRLKEEHNYIFVIQMRRARLDTARGLLYCSAIPTFLEGSFQNGIANPLPLYSRRSKIIQ